MALDEYRRKRAANRTPEPVAGATIDKTATAAGGTVADLAGAQEVPASMGVQTFVVQKHAARRLHYDFRLELGGVLLSWAVPKGPSLDPAVKRLAMQVEDHPVEYADFEGIIPSGNYGAGAVIVWDRGAWRAVEDPVAGLKKGKLLFELSGYKLHGVWQLVRTQGSKNEWLLIKKPDRWAATEGQKLLPSQSVLSGLELEEVGAAPERAAEMAVELQKMGARKRPVRADDMQLMLAQTAPHPFSDSGWLFELKYDGYRLLAERFEGRCKLHYRSGLDASHLFPDLVRSVDALPWPLLLDGEVVVLDGEGKPRFQELQKRVQLSRAPDIARASVERPATLYVFDLIAFDGWDLRPLPLSSRKMVLQSILPRLGPLRFADHVEGEGVALYEEVRRRGLEGIIAKRADSPYRSGRSSHWLKIKSDHSGDFAIIGFSPSEKVARTGFGALQLGVRDGDHWVHVGGVGSGFSEEQLREMRAQLDPLLRPRAPVEQPKPLTPRGTKWVEPRLVCEVRYAQYTDDGTLRHPVFMRLRTDKPADQCAREPDLGGPSEDGEDGEGAGAGGDAEREAASDARANADARADFAADAAAAAEPERKVPLTNQEKIFWPAESYTKGDLVEYYRAISPSLLPYLADRPVVLTRYPDGIGGKSFFQHNAPKFIPGWLRTERFWEEESGKETDYLILDNLESLLYVANLGTIPIHARSSRAATVQLPDWCIVDLDPKGAPFAHVVKLAKKLHALCDDIGLPSFCKTSGQAGLHVMVPLGRQVTHEQSRNLALLLARVVAEAEPDIATVARPLNERGGRVYLDFLQNGHGRTLVAPFSVRPVDGAPASTPLKWSEVGAKLDPRRFTIKTLPARLDKLAADPLLDVLTLVPDLGAVLERLDARLKAPPKKR